MQKLALLLALVAACSEQVAGQERLQVAPPRKSDAFATDEKGQKFRVQHGELAPGNFRIAGVDLALEEDVFKQAGRIFGPAQMRETGDASTGDSRVCYMSTNRNDQTRLYFHAGEVDEWFVLSSTTPASERTDVCKPSNKVSESLSTASGLHLGMTQHQVISVLGLPTRRNHSANTGVDSMAYEFETRKKASESELAAARKANPDMSEQKLLENYEYYYLSELIKMKFVRGLMTELTADWSTTD